MADPTTVLRALLAQLPPDQRSPLEPRASEQLVPGRLMLDVEWLAGQLVLRGRRWQTDDRRVLTTLWWYSASVWAVTPTLASLALSNVVLSAEPKDLGLHWLPDSRITGATSTRVLPSGNPLQSAGDTLRCLYDQVIPRIAELAGMRARPLWAIAADSVANRLLWLGESVNEADRFTPLLAPLTEHIGTPFPLTRYTATAGTPGLQTRRCSCCLLYLAPAKDMCTSCPRQRSQRLAASSDP